jgi:methionyl-tRNA formyltransferase
VRYGAHGAILRAVVGQPGIELCRLVLSENITSSKKQHWTRKARKLRRIGLLGGLVGLRIRRWNADTPTEDICEVARELTIPVERTPRYNCERTRELFRRADVDLGIALGTGILKPRLFSIPKLGMINVHGDVLPRFRGGTSVIWPVYEGVGETGFSIHKIDKGIDTGDILHVERFPIRFEPTLRGTYRRNVAEIRSRVPATLARVLGDFEKIAADAAPQPGGTTYTTPSFRQFLQMRRQNRRLYRRQLDAAGRASGVSR